MKQHFFFSLLVLTWIGSYASCNNNNDTIKVTVTEGTNMAVALSPDNSTLAMSLQGTIWTVPIDGGQAKDITDGMGDCLEPVWSPDGTHIAFHSYRDGNYHIWTMKSDGSDLKQLTSGLYDDREPDWSPDGQSIIFSSDRSGNYDIWQINLEDGRLNQLTSDEADDFNPAFSPDGNSIAFVSRRSEAGIYVLEDGEERLAAPSSLRLAAPSWSKDGAQLLFSAYGNNIAYMYLVDLSGQAITELSSTEDLFPFRAGWLSNDMFIYAADGQIKKRMIGKEQVDVIPFEATFTLTRPAYAKKQYDFDDRQERAPLGIIGPSVSPDGTQVAFAALGDLYIQEIGGKLMQVTDDPYVDLDPDWSPDGNTLAYISDRGGQMQVWLYDIATAEHRLLTTRIEEEVATPSWSPNGQQIAFFTSDYRKKWGAGTLMVADVHNGNVEEVHESIFVPSKPTWSPDGKTIAVMALNRHSMRYREGFNNFLLISLADGTSQYVSPDPNSPLSMRNQNGPVWSPDGNAMAYVKDGVLWTVPVSSVGEIIGEPKQITDELADNLSWTGDSKSVVYIATDQLKKVDVQSGHSSAIAIDLKWTPALQEADYIIHAGKLFDGVDSTYKLDVDIYVQGHRIKEIKPHTTHEAGASIIDASDKVVMPGLFEMHSHQSSSAGEMLGKLWLSYGITSVRDPGSDPYDSRERMESWSSGARPGPRLFFNGGLFDGGRVAYGLTHSVTQAEHIEMELERARKLEYNLIKTYVRMSDSIQKVFTEGAHAMGIPVSSHELYPASKYNVDAIEHLSATSRRGYSLKETALHARYNDVLRLIAKSGISVTPTIAVEGRGFWKMMEAFDGFLTDPRMTAFHAEAYIQSMRTSRPHDPVRLKALQQSVYDIVNSGGRITAGTDSPLQFPYAVSLHTELWSYVDGGLTPFQALQAATVHAAEAVGVADHLGTVTSGKLADLLIIDGDPLNRIEDTMNIIKVVKDGNIYTIEDWLTYR